MLGYFLPSMKPKPIMLKESLERRKVSCFGTLFDIRLTDMQIRHKNGLWWPCSLTDKDEMSNPYRGPAIDASYQVAVHLAKRFQRRYLKIGQSETIIACGGHAW